MWHGGSFKAAKTGSFNQDQQNLSIFNFSNSKDLIRKQPTICNHRPLPYQFQKLQNLTHVGWDLARQH